VCRPSSPWDTGGKCKPGPAFVLVHRQGRRRKDASEGMPAFLTATARAVLPASGLGSNLSRAAALSECEFPLSAGCPFISWTERQMGRRANGPRTARQVPRGVKPKAGCTRRSGRVGVLPPARPPFPIRRSGQQRRWPFVTRNVFCASSLLCNGEAGGRAPRRSWEMGPALQIAVLVAWEQMA